MINQLLSLPFVLKVATRDFHPNDHISFGTSHNPPNNVPFESRIKIFNPSRENESQDIPVWPVHCVQGTRGADIIPEIDSSKLDVVVDKGKDKRLEMFSGFADVFGSKASEAASHDLAALLKREEITHIYIVGIAGDFCVKCTALDARKEGFEVYTVEEAIRSVDPGVNGWGAAKKDLEHAGIETIHFDSPEVAKVRSLA